MCTRHPLSRGLDSSPSSSVPGTQEGHSYCLVTKPSGPCLVFITSTLSVCSSYDGFLPQFPNPVSSQSCLSAALSSATQDPLWSPPLPCWTFCGPLLCHAAPSATLCHAGPSAALSSARRCKDQPYRVCAFFSLCAEMRDRRNKDTRQRQDKTAGPGGPPPPRRRDQ